MIHIYYYKPKFKHFCGKANIKFNKSFVNFRNLCNKYVVYRSFINTILFVLLCVYLKSDFYFGRKLDSSVAHVGGLDKNYRIYDSHYLLNKSNDNGSQVEQYNNNNSKIMLSTQRLPTPERLIHRMSQNPENLRHNSGLRTNSKSREISKNISKILGKFLDNYDCTERPGHGGRGD